MFRIHIVIKILLLSAICSSVENQILDVSYPMIFEDPQLTKPPLAQRKTYFGYSVVLFSGSNSTWIQIGAPRANCTSQESISEPGRIYRCGLPGPCHFLPVDPSGNKCNSDYCDLKDGGWLGASQAVHQIGDQVAVCAPRWKDQKEANDWGMQGACYTARASDTPGQSWSKYLPLLGHNVYANSVWKNTYVYDYFLGQAGISMKYHQDQILEDKPVVQLILGAPGVLNWRGSAVLMTQYSLSGSVSEQQASFLNRSLVDSVAYDLGIVTHLMEIKDIVDADYFGYSVTSGRFFSKIELLHVASSPRGNGYRGNVMLFEFPIKTHDRPRMRFILRGSEVGGYFGASLAAADLSGDFLDDLMVAAPHQAKPKVYIFLGSSKGSLAAPQNGPQYLEAGPQLGDDSQFGAALATADLDQDGFYDVLVGAPGAGPDGSGALLIYNGGPQGVESDTPSQIIFAKDITPHLRMLGFGNSISPPVDVDGNNYPDVAIGAYLSGHVVFLRGRARAQLVAWITGPEQLQRNTTTFTITACMDYHPFRHSVKAEIVVEWILAIDRSQKRAYLESDSPATNVYVHKRIAQLHKKNCENLNIKIVENLQNFFDPIEITLNVTVHANNTATEPTIIRGENIKGTEGFDKEQPVVRPADSMLSLPFATGCGEDGICEADLRIKAFFPDIGNSGYVLGSLQTMRLQIEIWNEGEPAYLAKVHVKIPPPASVAKLPPACQVEPMQPLSCNVDVVKTILLDIDMSSVKGSELHFPVDVVTKSVEVSPKNNFVNVTLPLVVEAKLQIAGKSMKETYSFRESDETHAEQFAQFEHIFEVQKIGASPVYDVIISVKIPQKYSLGSRQVTFVQIYQPEGFQSGQPFSCQDTDLVYFTNKDIKRTKISDFKNSIHTFETVEKIKLADPQGDVLNEPIIDTVGIEKGDGEIHKSDDDTKEFPANRTVRITCEADGIVCHELRCMVGPFHKSQTVARLLITMKLNVSLLRETIIGDKDIIVLQSQGLVKVTGPNSAGVINGEPAKVNSVFVITPPEVSVDLWVVAISLIVGLLLFLLLSMGLVKAGFFQRKMKEELEALKEAAVRTQVTQQSEDPDAEKVEGVSKDNEIDLSSET